MLSLTTPFRSLEMHLAISLYLSCPLLLFISTLPFTPDWYVSSAPSSHTFMFGSMPIRSLREAPWGSTTQVNPEAEFGSTDRCVHRRLPNQVD
ncbi:hypothetical protein QBC32DRAFT_347912, partial [Pseudoneurospora amorphoporcata]